MSNTFDKHFLSTIEDLITYTYIFAVYNPRNYERYTARSFEDAVLYFVSNANKPLTPHKTFRWDTEDIIRGRTMEIDVTQVGFTNKKHFIVVYYSLKNKKFQWNHNKEMGLSNTFNNPVLQYVNDSVQRTMNKERFQQLLASIPHHKLFESSVSYKREYRENQNQLNKKRMIKLLAILLFIVGVCLFVLCMIKATSEPHESK